MVYGNKNIIKVLDTKKDVEFQLTESGYAIWQNMAPKRMIRIPDTPTGYVPLNENEVFQSISENVVSEDKIAGVSNGRKRNQTTE
jgi:hypothetical protein